MNLTITPNLTTPNCKTNAVKQNASKQQSFGISIDETDATILKILACIVIGGLGVHFASTSIHQHSDNKIRDMFFLNNPNISNEEFLKMSEEVDAGKTTWGGIQTARTADSLKSVLDKTRERFLTANPNLSKKDVADVFSKCGDDINCWETLDVKKLHLPR